MELSDACYFTHLLSCSFEHRCPENKPDTMEWEKIYLVCKRQKIANTVYPVVKLLHDEQKNCSLSDTLMHEWREEYQKAVVREITFDAARTDILQAMEQAKIKYLPLKGILMKAYYPSVGMRTFADNDILYDAKEEHRLKKLMTQLGYEAKSLQKGNHDIYQKPPILNFEMHRSLVGKDNPHSQFADQIWDRAVKDEGNGFGYHMTKEDFYLFFLIHADKHYSHAGIGIRMLADQFLFLKKEKDSMNWDGLIQYLEKMQLTGFEQNMRSLGEHLFSGRHPDTLPDGEKKLFLEFITSGVYGTSEKRYENRFLEGRKRKDTSIRTKLGFFIHRLFPKLEWMREYFPITRRFPWMYPFIILFRVVRGLFCKRKEIKGEARTVINYRSEK